MRLCTRSTVPQTRKTTSYHPVTLVCFGCTGSSSRILYQSRSWRRRRIRCRGSLSGVRGRGCSVAGQRGQRLCCAMLVLPGAYLRLTGDARGAVGLNQGRRFCVSCVAQVQFVLDTNAAFVNSSKYICDKRLHFRLNASTPLPRVCYPGPQGFDRGAGHGWVIPSQREL